MSDSLRHFLELAGIGVIIMGLLAVLFLGLNKATGFANRVFGKMDNMTAQIDESDYTKYDGALVTGSEVISAIKYYQSSLEPISVVVDGKTFLYEADLVTPATNNIANATRRGNPEYINPNAKYLGAITRDPNNYTVTTVTFTIQP